MMGPETFAFATAMLVNFVDMMGNQFTAPVTVPYGRWMGADLETIAFFATVRGVAAIVSNIWMPMLSDRQGRKLVIMISLVGSAIAYTVQGLAGHFVGSSVAIFIAGRALAGFFGGTMPVVRAYVTELSMPDTTLMRTRMTLMMVSSQASGIALSPIAGALATFGLSLPYYVCGSVGVCGLFWAICFFKEASALKADKNSAIQQATKSVGDLEQNSPAKEMPLARNDEEVTPERKQVWRDKVMVMLFFAYMAVFVLVSAIMLLMPELLEQESFGLIGKDREETSQNISKALGLTHIPQGVCNILSAVLLFGPLTARFGDAKVVTVAGTVAALSIGTYGFWPTKLWQVVLLQSITGLSFGCILPAIAPLVAQYASTHYPAQMAECQGIPILGMNLSMAFGQNVLALVYTHSGMKGAWLLAAFCTIVFVILFVLSSLLVSKRAAKIDALTPGQRKVALETGGEDANKFIDAVCEELRERLVHDKQKLWNGPIQFLVRQRLNAVLPEICEWSDSTNGQKYLDELSSLLQAFPDESLKFHAKFPQAGALPRSQLGMMNIDAESGIVVLPTLQATKVGKVAQDQASPGGVSRTSQSPKSFVDVVL